MNGMRQALADMEPPHPREALAILEEIEGSRRRFQGSLPFAQGDVTVGVENELQAVVVGDANCVDLPLVIRERNFYINSGRRPQLDRYLTGGDVWENSWVRFRVRALAPLARTTLRVDLLADKAHPEKGPRSDCHRFLFRQAGEEWVRIPVSYLLKLALADALGTGPRVPGLAWQTGRRLLGHFSNDNTSPETRSFHLVLLQPSSGMGQAVARETAKRFLLTQLLTMYANAKLGLTAQGQRAAVYFAPHPPVRQRELNGCVSDAFYRDLFMSPCLSGWDQGEVKQRYMHLCHEVLSRSQLNAIAKLREAGIIARDLVVLPNTSNVSLANNGTHVSLGSRTLTRARGDAGSGFTAAHEKVLGDLVIKIVEHFLPLFVGTYSAAPYRLDFADFHPELVLGFLPHELDVTHLRMLWRGWRRKAHLRVLGQPLTPFGPRWLDRMVAAVGGLRGDVVPDFRLLDYPVALLSTDQSPGLNGRPGNTERLKQDLTDLGVIDARMALYLPYRLREYGASGFSGFEGRQYSLLPGFMADLAPAVDLQLLATALAFKYIAEGQLDHAGIPDDPTVESERRQPFFAAAIGLGTFFARAQSGNRLPRRILERTARLRASRSHPGHLRVQTREYRRALLRVLQEDARDLAASLGLEAVLTDLGLRLEYPDEGSATGRLLCGILDKAGVSSALKLEAPEFNRCAEAYYREELRRRHMAEAIDLLGEDLRTLDRRAKADERIAATLKTVLGGQDVASYLARVTDDLLAERMPVEELRRLIRLVVTSISHDAEETEAWRDGQKRPLEHAASVH
jgi:hypothetical protein